MKLLQSSDVCDEEMNSAMLPLPSAQHLIL